MAGACEVGGLVFVWGNELGDEEGLDVAEGEEAGFEGLQGGRGEGEGEGGGV